MAKDKAKEADPLVQEWLTCIASYEREFKKWEQRVEKITKRYKDEGRSRDAGCRFNVLWSNVQTALPATFSRLPQPDVSRRFKDTDPVGRVAALILERGLEFEIEHYPDYRASMRESVLDRFLGGRGVSWVRYEPHTKTIEEPAAEAVPDDGVEVTEDTDEAPNEELEYECAPADYVFWKDFGHTIARTWEEVTGVWRKVYMGREALVERFGEKLGGKIPLDTKPESDSGKSTSQTQDYEACIYEIWDKTTGNAMWLSKSLGEMLDTKPDPLKLENFWPCPRPLYATLTNESLVPVPDFTLYQDQANTLDIIADRIEGLVRMLQVKGVYDASEPALARLFKEGENGDLLPIKNWAAFAEKAGLKGAVDVMDLTPIFSALKECYGAAEQQKNQIYEVMGLADIIRGSTDPRETAEAQKQKGNWGSMRLRSMQADVAQFATEILQIKAQIMCGQFQPETLAKIGGAQNLSEDDQQYVEQALQLLKTASLRDFRIEIVADSMIYMDEIQEKQDRMEMLTATGNFLKEAVPAAESNPQLAPLLMEMLKFGVEGFKVGKTLEGTFDTVADQLKKIAANPPPKQDPEMAKVQAQSQLADREMQMKGQLAKYQADLDAQTEQAKQAFQAQQTAQQNALESQRASQKAQLESHLLALKATLEAQSSARETEFKRWEAMLDAKTKIAVAEIAKAAKLEGAQLAAASAEASGGSIADDPKPQPQPQGGQSAPVPG